MSWTASAFLSELQDRFIAWDGLAGVEVSSAPIPIDKLKAKDYIVFVRVEGEQEWAALGNQSKDDNYTIESSVLVVKKGAGEAKAAEVRERAGDILVEIENALRDLVTSNAMPEMAAAIGASQITKLSLARFQMSQGASPDGRWTELNFDIVVTARI